MEQALIREGMPVGEIHRLCDLHVTVFRDGLEAQEDVQAPPGHPLATLLAENREIMKAADHWAGLCRAVTASATALPAGLSEALESLAQVNVHYTRKENQLFPYLEKHGFTGPSQVMWGLHDDVRRLLKDLRSAIRAGDAATLVERGPEAARIISEMIYKNAILEAFKSGAREQADFWLSFKGKFLYIAYYAVRDPHGRYLGTLEVTQDITRLRELEGEKRLLDWTI